MLLGRVGMGILVDVKVRARKIAMNIKPNPPIPPVPVRLWRPLAV